MLVRCGIGGGWNSFGWGCRRPRNRQHAVQTAQALLHTHVLCLPPLHLSSPLWFTAASPDVFLRLCWFWRLFDHSTARGTLSLGKSATAMRLRAALKHPAHNRNVDSHLSVSIPHCTLSKTAVQDRRPVLSPRSFLRSAKCLSWLSDCLSVRPSFPS